MKSRSNYVARGKKGDKEKQNGDGAKLGFEEKMGRLVKSLNEQCAESSRLEQEIRRNLERLGYGG